MRKSLFCMLISIAFLVLHIWMMELKLGDTLNLVISLLLMLIAQICAYLADRHLSPKQSFKGIFAMLACTEILAIILLTLHSWLFNVGGHNTIDWVQITTSVIVFGIVFPFLITSALWILLNKSIREMPVKK